MKKWFLIILVILVSSCGLLKDVTRDRKKEQSTTKTRIFETKKERGEIIILPAPMIPNKTIRDTVIEYKTARGATVSKNYDSGGELTNTVVVCPDSEETKQTDIKSEYALKSLEVEKRLNIETINAIGKWLAIILIPIGFFFALAWWARKRIA
jgi:hypothetical protein